MKIEPLPRLGGNEFLGADAGMYEGLRQLLAGGITPLVGQLEGPPMNP